MVAVGWMLRQRSNVLCVGGTNLQLLLFSFNWGFSDEFYNNKQSRLLWLDLNNYVLTTILFESAKRGFNGSYNDFVLTSLLQFAYKV